MSKNDHLKLIDYGTSVMVHETKQLLNVCKNTNQSIPHSKYKKYPSLIGILQLQQLIKEYAVEYELQVQDILKCLQVLLHLMIVVVNYKIRWFIYRQLDLILFKSDEYMKLAHFIRILKNDNLTYDLQKNKGFSPKKGFLKNKFIIRNCKLKKLTFDSMFLRKQKKFN